MKRRRLCPEPTDHNWIPLVLRGKRCPINRGGNEGSQVDDRPKTITETGLPRALESTSRAITDFDVHRRETTSLSAVGRGRTVVKGLSLMAAVAVILNRENRRARLYR